MARPSDMASPDELKAEILRLSREYSAQVHGANHPVAEERTFAPGQTIPYAARVFDADEVAAAVGATLDFWLTLGPEGDAFEKELAGVLGVKKCLLTNSGSSANLLALSALTSRKLGDRRLLPGDEVITCAAGFPTTVAPILQNQAVPVFLDADPATLNVQVEQLEEAFVEGRTKAVMMAHTLGNPFDLGAVTAFCQAHNLWLIEDNCDALGSTYRGKLTGTFGDLSTQSFYPPHHITMGEGGAVNIVNDMKFKVLVESFRDWGRDCWCASGHDNTCHKRFGWQLGELPEGYDHKYIYSHLGYNLKPLDIQAAIGRIQLTRLVAFGQARRKNWAILRAGLNELSEYFSYQIATPGSDPSWFGFLLMVRPGAGFSRADLSRHLDEKKIGNRALFGGNLVRQPAFADLRKENPRAFRVIGDLAGADRIMNDALFVGVYPGLSESMLDFLIKTLRDFVRRS